MRSASPVTYLNHDHCEGENVRFLAICSPVQDLWCSPSRSVTIMTRGAPDGVQVLGDHSEAEIRYARVIGAVNEDVHLLDVNAAAKRESKKGHTPLRSP